MILRELKLKNMKLGLVLLVIGCVMMFYPTSKKEQPIEIKPDIEIKPGETKVFKFEPRICPFCGEQGTCVQIPMLNGKVGCTNQLNESNVLPGWKKVKEGWVFHETPSTTK